MKLAKANGVHERIQMYGACDAEFLRRILNANGRTLVICDVDGAEIEILDLKAVPLLSKVDILVETHDLLRPGITEELVQRFGESHEIERLDSQLRSTDDLPAEVTLSEELALAPWMNFAAVNSRGYGCGLRQQSMAISRQG